MKIRQRKTARGGADAGEQIRSLRLELAREMGRAARLRHALRLLLDTLDGCEDGMTWTTVDREEFEELAGVRE